MGQITYILIALIINAINCAPVNDSNAKPPAISLFSSTTEIIEQSKSSQVQDSKSSSSSSSEESKESAPSPDVTKTRLVRDNEHSGTIAQQTKDLPQAIFTPPAVMKEPATPQLPARGTRETNEQAAAAPAIVYTGYGPSSSTSSSTTASTTVAGIP